MNILIISIIICICLLLRFAKSRKKEEKPKSVSKIAETASQPYKGYLPISRMDFQREGGGEEELSKYENISASKIGMAVDYLTRVETGASKRKVFKSALSYAKKTGKIIEAEHILNSVKGLDDESIKNTIRLCTFEARLYGDKYLTEKSHPLDISDGTIKNVRKMVYRTLDFLKANGGCVWSDFTFEGGYTNNVRYGEGDFLTSDTLWDLKTYKSPLTSKNTLQILIYWRLGVHSKYNIYKQIKYIGLYNPRKNISYKIAVDEIPLEVINKIDREIIGYKR